MFCLRHRAVDHRKVVAATSGVQCRVNGSSTCDRSFVVRCEYSRLACGGRRAIASASQASKASAAQDDMGILAACGGRVWEDPSVFGINKRSSHVPLHVFPSEAGAFEHVAGIGRVVQAADVSANKVMLNGMWDFHLFAKPEDVPAGFWQPASTSSHEWKQV